MAFAQIVTHLTVAAPFLLLPSCRSLHVIEGGHGLQETLVIGVHHKTGIELAMQTSRCFDSSFKCNVAQRWKGHPLGPHEKVLHITRNPISLALSSYLYHKETGEDWTRRPGGEMERVAEDPYLRRFMINSSEPYTDFLRRVDAKVGIRAEINRLSHNRGVLNEMESGEKFCGLHSRCMQLCLEDFTVSSSSYDSSWRKVLRFMGKHITPQMGQCLSKADLNRHLVNSHSRHVTSNMLSKRKYKKLRKLVVEVDASVFNSRLKRMGEGRLYCGGYYSQSFQIQADSNASDGDEYAEWLTEEEYSKMGGL